MPKESKAIRIKEFKSLKLDNCQYSIGDSIRILESNDHDSFGKINRI